MTETMLAVNARMFLGAAGIFPEGAGVFPSARRISGTIRRDEELAGRVVAVMRDVPANIPAVTPCAQRLCPAPAGSG